MLPVENDVYRSHFTVGTLAPSGALRAAEEIRSSVVSSTIAGAAPQASSSRATLGIPVTDNPIPVLRVHYAAAKRSLDVALALFGLILGAPIFLIAAALVKLSSRGPILFRQIRVGEGGRHFTCLKFRSMYVGADDMRAGLQHLNEVSGPVFKMRNDPRVTPVGRWLRKFSIDELPQLWNVLCGEMSMVGPRPPTPCEVSLYTHRQLGRLAVRPGLTCLWQVSGRSTIPFERWVELDLLYIETMSFWTDLRIILRTIPAVVLSRGAL